MISADAYLHIPEAYGRWLGGLRWSTGGEAVEFPDGQTFAFGRELSLFLDGFAADREPIHFAHILHLMHLLLRGPLTRGPMARMGDLARELPAGFGVLGRPHRNAGALCAMLCEGVPGLPDPPDLEGVCLALTAGAVVDAFSGFEGDLGEVDTAEFPAFGTEGGPPDEPPLAPGEFERRVLERLDRLSTEVILHWLRLGRGPGPEARARSLADRVEHERPRSYRSALEPLLDRPRLSRSAALIDRLVGALALPPRRRTFEALPTGGFADLANRGHPERLLPSQHAIEADEFLRRFAEHELLYYRREEPHAIESEELVVLIDQGVRTWGPVRPVLAAAAVALARLADRRGVCLRIGASSDPGRLVDPTLAEPEALASLLEASDLSSRPTALLDAALAGGSGRRRDLVLLTHPRTLGAPEVEASCRGLAPGDRLFAVLVNDRNEVQLAEVRGGRPVALARFRADSAEPGPAPSARRSTLSEAWRGDVEPVGFPIARPPMAPAGTTAAAVRGAFDGSGEWFAAVGSLGVPLLWRVDGSIEEALPRGFSGGEVVREVEELIGVAGGFVVVGRIGPDRRPVAVHYDLASRQARAYVKYLSDEHQWAWFYVRESHALIARGDSESWYVDLRSGGRFSSQDRCSVEAVARDLKQVGSLAVPPPQLVVLHDDDTSPSTGPAVRLRRADGVVSVEGMSPPWRRFRPISDGQPVLRGWRLLGACCCGRALALYATGDGEGQGEGEGVDLAPGGRWLLFRDLGGDPVPIRPGPHMPRAFADLVLSPDGNRVALREADRSYAVYAVAAPPALLLHTRGAGRLGGGTPGRSGPIDVSLGGDWMVLAAGRRAVLVRWGGGRLEIRGASGDPGSLRSTLLGGPGGPPSPVISESAPGLMPSWASYDPMRFAGVARGLGLVAVVDRAGQVVLADAGGAVIAVLGLVGGALAARLPDGSGFGPPGRGGPGSPTPGAEDRLARALREAAGRGTIV